jgi:hypothetical protein
MVTPITEPHLSTSNERVYYSLDDAVSIDAGAVAGPIDAGWIELERNSKFELKSSPAKGDGQVRADRAHAHQVQVNAAHTASLDIKLLHGTDPNQDMDLTDDALLRLLRVRSDGSFAMILVCMGDITEGGDVAGLPTWTGSVDVIAHPIRGKITPWPPA